MKLHNAMWPGLVGKGSPGAEPFIELDTMLDLTAKAEAYAGQLGLRFERRFTGYGDLTAALSRA